jgi:hypothetical protein
MRDPNPSIFYKLEAESINWTGYNSSIVEAAVEEGKRLVKVNAQLSDVDRGTKLRYARNILGVALSMFLVGAAIFGIGIAVRYTDIDRAKNSVRYEYEEKLKEEYAKGFQAGQFSKFDQILIDDYLKNYSPDRVLLLIKQKSEK